MLKTSVDGVPPQFEKDQTDLSTSQDDLAKQTLKLALQSHNFELHNAITRAYLAMKTKLQHVPDIPIGKHDTLIKNELMQTIDVFLQIWLLDNYQLVKKTRD